MKLNINKENYKVKFLLSFESDKIQKYIYNYDETIKSSKTIALSDYNSIDCYSEKCSKEKDYIGYLIFLKNKLKTLEN